VDGSRSAGASLSTHILSEMKLYFDGSYQRGKACYGFLLSTKEGFIVSGDYLPGVTSPMVAEYEGLIAGLRVSKDFDEDLEIAGDSKMVLSSISGQSKVRDKELRPLLETVIELLPEKYTLRWVPRKKNLADKHSRCS